jgi:hypothetical protein
VRRIVDAAVEATAFSSSSASTPAVAAKNTSSGDGAKAVYGNAPASSGRIFGVYGHAGSARGFGVYSAGRLGSIGDLVCPQCVKGGDIDAATFPTVPSAADADHVGGHAPAYFAHVVPLSVILPSDFTWHLLATVNGLQVWGYCETGGGKDGIAVSAASASTIGTANYFVASANTVVTNGTPLGTSRFTIATSQDTQVEGIVVYRNNATGRIITTNFHLWGHRLRAVRKRDHGSLTASPNQTPATEEARRIMTAVHARPSANSRPRIGNPPICAVTVRTELHPSPHASISSPIPSFGTRGSSFGAAGPWEPQLTAGSCRRAAAT